MILAKDKEGREKALAEILPHQINDFEGLFRSMSPYPVIVRLLDPLFMNSFQEKQMKLKDLANDLKYLKLSLISKN